MFSFRLRAGPIAERLVRLREVGQRGRHERMLVTVRRPLDPRKSSQDSESSLVSRKTTGPFPQAKRFPAFKSPCKTPSR